MSHCRVLEIAFGHCSSWDEGSGWAQRWLTLEQFSCSQLVLSPGSHWGHIPDVTDVPAEVPGWQPGSRVAVEHPCCVQGQIQRVPSCTAEAGTPPHAGCKIKVAACFWQLLWKLRLWHSIALCLTQLPESEDSGILNPFL